VLVPRLKAEREVSVIRSPRDQDIQDIEPVIVERRLDDHLHCLLSVSGRAFVEGRKIPLLLNLMPVEKVTVQGVAIHLDGQLGIV
jgi:hypothetical protein